MTIQETLTVRALRTSQGNGADVYSFFAPGHEIVRIADISRLERDEDENLKGFQRKEIRNHIKNIVEYLDQGNVLFPSAIILAFAPEIQFKQSRGPKPKNLTDVASMGTLSIPIREEGDRVAWVVDGQQRSFALARSENSYIPVPVVGFISEDLQTQREQFILINKARPLPSRLINELLPTTGVLLPRDLAVRKIPSELCNLMNRDSRSPFYRLIKRMSDVDGSMAVIVDTAIINMLKHSISNPLGALSPYKGTKNENADIDSMYRITCGFWSAMKNVFSDAWGKDPRESRLMHSAGIQAGGILMDRIMARLGSYNEGTEKQLLGDLESMAPLCHWTSGVWEGLGLEWDEIQSVPRHIRGLADELVRIYNETKRS